MNRERTAMLEAWWAYHQASRGRTAVEFNRRMRKTARPVVWEPWRAQSRQGDPIFGGGGGWG